MKNAIMIMVVVLMAGVVQGQWLPVTVNTNTGVYKPINIAQEASTGLTNIYHTSGTVSRAYVNGRSAVVQFNTNVSEGVAVTTLIPLLGTNYNAYAVGTNGYVVFNTNATPFVYPDWYRPTTNYNDSLLWYTFDSSNAAYIVDVTSNGNHGEEVFGGARQPMWWDYAYRVSRREENYVQTVSSNVCKNSSGFTIAMWVYFDEVPGSGAEFAASGKALEGALVTNNDFIVSLNKSAANTLQLWVMYGGDVNALTYVNYTSFAPSTGVWHRIVAVYQKNGVAGIGFNSFAALYMDGQYLASRTDAMNMFTPVPDTWSFGGGRGMGKGLGPYWGAWNGAIDDCIITDWAWTYGTITNDFNAGRTLGP